MMSVSVSTTTDVLYRLPHAESLLSEDRLVRFEIDGTQADVMTLMELDKPALQASML